MMIEGKGGMRSRNAEFGIVYFCFFSNVFLDHIQHMPKNDLH